MNSLQQTQKQNTHHKNHQFNSQLSLAEDQIRASQSKNLLTLQTVPENQNKKYLIGVILFLLLVIAFLVYDIVEKKFHLNLLGLPRKQNKKSLQLQPKYLTQQQIQQQISKYVKEKSNQDLADYQKKFQQKQILLNQREKSISEREKILEQKQNSLQHLIKNANSKPQVKHFQQPNVPITIPTIAKYQQNMSLVFPQPTVGMKYYGQQFNSTNVGSNFRQFQTLLSEILKPYNDTDCVMKRYGDKEDGGYLVCQNLLSYSNVLLNFGIEGRDKFGCQLITAFPMPNFQYDCTNTTKPICSTNQNTFFSLTCIGDRSQRSLGNKVYMSLEDIFKNRNLTNKHFSIKMDTQGAEWPGFRTLPLKYLDNIDQIFIEIHLNEPLLWGYLDIMRAINQKFISVSLHMNNYDCNSLHSADSKSRIFPSRAFEVLLVNRNLMKIKKNTRSYKLHPSFLPNNARSVDCQMSDQL